MASPPHEPLLPPPGTDNQSASPSSDVKKCGYLKKQKHGHKRFFVLRGGGGGAAGGGVPARLEYYDSEKKWRNKSAAKRVIPLDGCLNVNKRADSKHRHLIALYTKDEYFAVAAESEAEQESWYRLLTALMTSGSSASSGSGSSSCCASNSSASSLLGFDEAASSYSDVTATKEVWQVNVKSKGLGQSRGLTGVHRLCLSSRTVSFVRLNAEAASVVLQLMNIRRCGHSDSFFFMEVGRSAATGPGELWMQADDSVVAQNIHETILEAMKAMKELSEFRPRSKSQSNPISVPPPHHHHHRRHLNNLPPSQTGLPLPPRRSRTDSVSATMGAAAKFSCRSRTASEGDGTLGGGQGQRAPLSRSHTISTRPCRTFEASSLQHSKSMSMPLSRSPPPGAPRPSSCSASFSASPSPSDAGFISCEEFGGSDPRLGPPLSLRSNTPESLRADETPPSGELDGYMVMERGCRRLQELDKAYRKRTYSLTTPRQPRGPPQVSSASLDEYTLMRATYTPRRCHTASPKGTAYPEDYRDGLHGDSGYMPMMPGVGVAPAGSKDDPYMPMSPMCVSAPKQIINPRSVGGPAPTDSPVGSRGPGSLEDSGYMRMWCGAKMSVESGEYLNMSPVDPLTPPEYILSPVEGGGPQPPPLLQHFRQPYSLPRPPKGPQQQQRGPSDTDQYVLMSLQRQRIDEESNYCPLAPGGSAGTPGAPNPLRLARTDGGLAAHRGRACRPTRLALEALRTLPCMSEHPAPSEPRSPGEYINIDFGAPAQEPPSESQGGSTGPPPLSDYANIDVGPLPVGAPEVLTCPPLVSSPQRGEGGREEAPADEGGSAQKQVTPAAKDDYTEMTFGPPPALVADVAPLPTSPSACVQRLSLESAAVVDAVAPLDSFLLGAPSLSVTLLDPHRGAKVIRADPQGRRRHSSETFSSTTTVTPVCPSFARDTKRHSSASVENVPRSVCGSQGPDEDYAGPMCREMSAGYQNGLNYIALNLMEGTLGACDGLLRFKTACGCKGGVNGFSGGPYAGLGFKETAAAAVKE